MARILGKATPAEILNGCPPKVKDNRGYLDTPGELQAMNDSRQREQASVIAARRSSAMVVHSHTKAP